MTHGNPRVAYGLRLIAVLGGLVALGGVAALVFLGAVVASESGVEIPVHLTLSEQGKVLLLYGGGGAFLAGAAVNVFGNAIAGFFAPTRRPAATSTGGEAAAESTVAGPDLYRRKLSRAYAFMAGFVLLLVTVDVFVPSLIGRNVNSVVDFAVLFAHYGVVLLFGSPLGAVVVVVLLGGLAYGIHVRSSEALLAGVVVAVLFLLAAVAIRSIGFAFAALWILYYSFRARGATKFRLADVDTIPPAVRSLVER